MTVTRPEVFVPAAYFSGFLSEEKTMRTFLCLTFVLILAAVSTNAATITVTNTNDDSLCSLVSCSLRGAIQSSAPGDSIAFAPLFNSPQTITLTLGQLIIPRSLTIDGPGANLLRIESNGSSRVMFINPAISFTLRGVTISNGSDGVGGGIYEQGSTVTIDSCHITSNNALFGGGGIAGSGNLTILRTAITNNTVATGDQSGGGLDAYGPLTMIASTVSGNTVQSGQFSAGGVYATDGGTIIGSTITGNSKGTATSSFDGVLADFTSIAFSSTIVAANGSGPDVGGVLSTGGFNLIGNADGTSAFSHPADQTGTGVSPIDPDLAPLALNGGTTPTHAVLLSSPAFDRGFAFGETSDQRNSVRIKDLPTSPNAASGDGTDIGAYEAGQVVTKTSDSDDGFCNADCSLREAVSSSIIGEFVIFSSAFNTAQTIFLGLGEVTIDRNLLVIGSGADNLTIDAQSLSRVFRISGPVTVSISGLTATGGNGIDGGAIFNQGGALLRLESMTVRNSSAVRGGGIYSFNSRLQVVSSTISGNSASGTTTAGGIDSFRDDAGVVTDVELTNSTVSGNSAVGGSLNAGGVHIRSVTFFAPTAAKNLVPQTASALISNSTISNNTAATGFADVAGGVRRGSGAAITVRSSIIAGNANNSVVPDVSGGLGFISGGFNLIGNVGLIAGFSQPTDQTGNSATPIDPVLLPLGMYGGPTPTHSVMPVSPSVDKGSAFGLVTDQRGLQRIFDHPTTGNSSDGADIGAFELQTATSANIRIAGRITDSAGNPVRNAQVILYDNAGSERRTQTGSFGLYEFSDLEAGGIYTLTALHGKHRFAAILLQITDDMTEVNLVEEDRETQ